MTVFIEFVVSVSALVEKEVPEGSDYLDVLRSVTRDDLVEADVQEAEWYQLKDAWQSEHHPHVYKSDEHGLIDWSEQVEE